MRTMMLVAALLLGQSSAGTTTTKNVDRTVPLPPTGSVTLQTHNGSIDVRTWDRQQVEIHARIEAGGTSAEDTRRFKETTVEIVSTSDSVWITSRYPSVSWWFGNNPSISYTITAPKSARWTIRDHNAHAEIRDLRAALTIATHNGSLRVTDFDGPLQVNAHNGTVIADFASFRGADITTHNGSVELALPSGTAFNLHADTRHASVQSDFPVVVHTWGRRGGSLDAVVSGGGPLLHFSSHFGQLRLVSKK